MMMTTMMIMVVRGKWWCGCWGGRWWSWGGKCLGGRPIPRPGRTLCVSLGSRNAHRHCTRDILCGKLQGKCQMLIPGPAFGASLCNRNDSKCRWTCHKRHFAQKFTGKMQNANPGASILCELVQSKCTWTCHKRRFVRKFRGKMPDASNITSIEHRALTVTVRTPSVWPHCLGKYIKTSGAILNKGV